MGADDTDQVNDPAVDPAAEETFAGPSAGEPSAADEGAADTAADAPAAEQEPEKDELAERTADLQRLSAEFANYRRRVARDKQTDIENAKASVLSELLPVLDDLDRARQHGDLESGPLKSVADKLEGVFTAQGVSSFGAEGDAFDPAVHEAVQHEGDGSNPVIGSVFRKGYTAGERVLRTAMVAVVDGPTGTESATDGPDSA
ncbi:nucleotide exchange factor GrpE [Rhodococcoides corynebacterioides]|uniref:Protein GrpE n=1 Tax=Rhodococcoides corynebacterioides TaxID=53972 RepID=A0ABS7NZ85_9NOCA|nr:nucleotide exchange factor GrpE [Rhodococcus corynebacterioides]MBY6365141.1 nucleotide exchange factor GrpE [Rhodococcus corynebacterioides]MBY6406553.1 nucleotide exchange factor GrpE [Rhodococcus corynebacterioides]